MERIGIYGGTFSPPHNGHLHAARCFLDAVHPDKLLIIPTCLPPHKQASLSANTDGRLTMCRLAFGDFPSVEISDIEIRRGGVSYTSDTLRSLVRPDRELFFLCGTDMFLTLPRWHEPEVIFSLAHIVYMARENDPETVLTLRKAAEEYRSRYAARITEIDCPAFPLSSSTVREKIARGEEWNSLVPEKVGQYIRENHLYRKG